MSLHQAGHHQTRSQILWWNNLPARFRLTESLHIFYHPPLNMHHRFLKQKSFYLICYNDIPFLTSLIHDPDFSIITWSPWIPHFCLFVILISHVIPANHQLLQMLKSSEVKLGLMHAIIAPLILIVLPTKVALTFTYLTVRQLGLLFTQWDLSYNS